MNQKLQKWSAAGFEFDLDWLLRNATTILTGQAMFSGLKDTDTGTFIEGLAKAEKACDYLLNLVSSRLGLDHDRVLGGRYAFPVMARYVSPNGGQIRSTREAQLLLYWYIHSFLWGRFAGSTESALNQDLRLLDPLDGALERLIDQLRFARGGDLRVRPEGNLEVGARRPEEYLAEIEQRHPGALASQWVPMDRELWRIDRFRDFLAARRQLLADAANQFLDSLLKESLPAFEAPAVLEDGQRGADIVAEEDDEEKQLLECIGWTAERHLPDGELMYELAAEDGSILAILDLAWPNGLQPGLSQPVAILLSEPAAIEVAVNQAGYRYFTSVEDFKRYVTTEVLAEPAAAIA